MRPVATRILCLSAALLVVMADGLAQERPATASTSDPRVGLKPGLRDAGVAARHMELVATLPKPPGFFDPKSPGGEATPAENPAQSLGNPSATTPAPAPAPAPANPPAAEAPPPAGRGGGAGASLGFANSDIAFTGHHLVLGSFNGFNTYDIENAKKPHLVASIVCPGGQGDVSVYGHLLFMSVEQTRGRVDCGTQGVEAPSSPERFRGVRIFDMSGDKPKQIAAIQTCRGSHTHTLVTTPNDRTNLYVYGSGTSTVRPGEELEGCSGKDPNEDPNTALFSIDVIQVPLAAPQTAKIVNRPRIFADLATGAIAGLEKGTPDRGPGTQPARVTNQCHDITVFPEVGLAAGACSGNGILLDISDPVHPVRLDAVTDKNFAYWHSATFNNDGTKIIFTDEWGGGTRPRCRATDPLTWGADAIFDIVDRKMRFGGYFKMPAAQTDQENCVAHNGSIIPIPGRDIMVQGWYQGGVSVFDFTDSAHAVEIAYFDRGPIDAKNLITGGYWSAYWYNGHIYGSEIARGIDVFALKPSPFLTENEIEAASLVRSSELNVQDQTRATWQAVPVVARAYLDQVTRAKALAPDRLRAVKSAIDRADGIKSARDKGAAASATELESLGSQLEREADSAAGRPAATLKALGATLKGMAGARR